MKGYAFVLAGLLAASCAWGADASGGDPTRKETTVLNVDGDTVTTTVEVKDGTVVVRSSTGDASATAGDTVVVDRKSVVKRHSSVQSIFKGKSVARVEMNGKTFEVSSDSGSVSASSNNDRVTITCGDVTLTGDTNTLKSGDKTYDISKSDTVKITVIDGQVEVNAGGDNKQE